MKNYTKFALVAALLVASMAISPRATAQSAEDVIVFALPYDFEEYSQFYASSYANAQWLSAVGAGLFSRSIDLDRAYDTELADSYTVSSDKLTYTITLKSGLKFSDGTDLTSEDVVFSYMAALSPAINTISYSFYAAFFDSNDSISAVDANTIQFTLYQPYAFALGLFTYSIVPKAHFEDRYAAGDFTWNAPDLSDSISAGPFKVESFDATNNEIVTVKNEYYWNVDNVRSDKVIFKKIGDKAAAISALADGEIDILDGQYIAGKNELDRVADKKEDFVATPSHQELSFNMLHPYMGDGSSLTVTDKETGAKNVRKAISHIINRDFAANDIMEGLALPAATIIPSVAIGWDPTIEPREYSITKAQELMEAAGFDYADLTVGSDGEFETFFFDITVLSPNTNEARNSWSALVAQTLPKIGIGVTAHESQDWGFIGPRTWSHPVPPPSYAEGGYDILFVGYGWDLDCDPTGLYDSAALVPNGDNFYNFDNAEYDQLLIDYTTELDLEDRINAFKALQAFYYEWEVAAPIVYPQEHWAYSANLVGWDSILLGGSSAEWDRIGFAEETAGTTESFLPIDISAFLVAFVTIGISIRFKKRN